MAIGVAKSLADVLRGDVTSIPASTFVVAYPQFFSGGASAVPTHYYTCLKDLILGPITATISASAWAANYVVDQFGYGLSNGKTIDIVVTRVIDGSEATEESANEQGAEMAEVFIYLKKPGALQAADRDGLANAALRIQRLLDWNYALNVVGGAPPVPVTDNTLDPRYPIKAYWQGMANLWPLVKAEEQSDKALAICFHVHYSRLFLK